MKNLFKALNLVKNSKKSTNGKVTVSSNEVERINAGNSTSAWGIVFYR